MWNYCQKCSVKTKFIYREVDAFLLQMNPQTLFVFDRVGDLALPLYVL